MLLLAGGVSTLSVAPAIFGTSVSTCTVPKSMYSYGISAAVRFPLGAWLVAAPRSLSKATAKLHSHNLSGKLHNIYLDRSKNLPRLFGIVACDWVGNFSEHIALDKDLCAHARVDSGLHAVEHDRVNFDIAWGRKKKVKKKK